MKLLITFSSDQFVEDIKTFACNFNNSDARQTQDPQQPRSV